MQIILLQYRFPCTVTRVYQTTDQLRKAPLLDLERHPAAVPIHFAGLELQENGMYKEQAFLEMLGNAIAEYDRILEDYAMEEAA